MSESGSGGSISGLEFIGFIAVIVLMRGCYHAGVIAEKLNPDAYKSEPLKDPDPTLNGLWPSGMMPLLEMN